MLAGSDEAKYWLEPVELAANYGFNGRDLTTIEQLIDQYQQELLEAWNEHFGQV